MSVGLSERGEDGWVDDWLNCLALGDVGAFEEMDEDGMISTLQGRR